MRPRLYFLVRWSIALVLGIGTALATVPETAWAGTKEARKFFKQAKKAYANGNYEKAATLLEKAYSEEANLTYQYNRIRALQGAEKYREALEVLETYEQPMLDAKGFEDIPKIKKQLEEKVGPTDSSDTSESSSPEPEPPADPAEPDSPKDDPEPEPEPDPGTGPSGGDTPPRSGNTGLRALGWSLAGGGLASIGVGTLFGSLALLPEDVRENARKDQVKQKNADLVRSHKTATIVFLGVGTAALVGGGIILINQLGSRSNESRAARTPRIRWSPYATPRGAGAQLELNF